jgi:mono/diheme cytochrome c family protein
LPEGAGRRLVLLACLLLLASAARAAEPASAAFERTCAICHGVGAVGAPGQFPRLAGRAGLIAKTPQGRRLLIAAALYGMTGRIQAERQTIVGVMPGFNQLTNAEICRILDYVTNLDAAGPIRPFTGAEVATVRASPMTPSEVNAMARDPAIVAAAP